MLRAAPASSERFSFCRIGIVRLVSSTLQGRRFEGAAALAALRTHDLHDSRVQRTSRSARPGPRLAEHRIAHECADACQTVHKR
jgi:hypothetical protein